MIAVIAAIGVPTLLPSHAAVAMPSTIPKAARSSKTQLVVRQNRLDMPTRLRGACIAARRGQHAVELGGDARHFPINETDADRAQCRDQAECGKNSGTDRKVAEAQGSRLFLLLSRSGVVSQNLGAKHCIKIDGRRRRTRALHHEIAETDTAVCATPAASGRSG
jgi:hypothetical protein